jgi:hypothetical protein
VDAKAESESDVVARLVVNPGTDASWEIQLQPGINTIGRSEENQFPIDHESVSSNHCQITFSERKVVLQDLGSVGGTFVDGELVETAVLRAGQVLRLGEVEMRFESAGLAVALAKPGPQVRVVHRSSPAASPIPAAAPVAQVASFAEGQRYCKVHPRVRARYICPKCGGTFCDFCVNVREGAEGGRSFCRACGEPCAPLPELPFVGVRNERTLAQQVWRAFAFPAAKDGLILLICGTIFYSVLGAVIGIAKYAFLIGLAAILLVTVFGTGYLINFLQRIVTGSAAGEESMPDWPEFTDLASDILGPVFQLVGTVVVCFLPAMAVGFVAAQESAWKVWVLGAALIYGYACLPMAFLAVTMFDSLWALNPLLVLPSILRVPREYFVALLLLAVVAGLQWGQQAMALVMPGFLAAVISDFAGLYLLAVEMRILGLLYRANSARLGWFQQRS